MLFTKCYDVTKHLNQCQNIQKEILLLLEILETTSDNATRNAIAIALGDRKESLLVKKIFDICDRPSMLNRRGSLIYALLEFDRELLIPYLSNIEDIADSKYVEEQQMAEMLLEQINSNS